MGDWRRRLKRVSIEHRIPPKPMKYTAVVQRIRKVTVEAETQERASRLLTRRLEQGEKILSVQTSLL